MKKIHCQIILFCLFILTAISGCKKDMDIPGGSAKPIQANAGEDQRLYSWKTNTTLNGSSSTTKLNTRFQWKQLSGPGLLQIYLSENLVTKVSGIQATGNYTFELTLQYEGIESRDTMQIQVVDDPNPNTAPIVQLGADTAIYHYKPNISLNAFVQDADGIDSVKWEILGSVPGFIIQPYYEFRVRVYFPLQFTGNLQIKLTAWDKRNVSTSDTIQVSVMLRPLEINPGYNRSINLPTNTIPLTVLANSSSNVTMQQWQLIGGPASAVIDNPNSPETHIRFSEPGTYFIRINVQNELNQTATEEVKIIVNPIGFGSPRNMRLLDVNTPPNNSSNHVYVYIPQYYFEGQNTYLDVSNIQVMASDGTWHTASAYHDPTNTRFKYKYEDNLIIYPTNPNEVSPNEISLNF